MRREFVAVELLRFLGAVDRHLTAPAALILLGGSAIALYGVAAGTTDIDTFETDLSKLQSAIELARAETGLDIPVTDTAVADAPYEYETRLQGVKADWTFLRVAKLERHDLALSKTVRGYENDLVAIQRLHEIVPLDLPTLVERYLNEMTHAIGNPDKLEGNFLLLIERLYGDMAAERVSIQISTHRSRHAGK